MEAAEREVHALVEQQLSGRLVIELEEGRRMSVGRVSVVRRGFGTRRGRPDSVAWFSLQVPVLGVTVRGRYPILIEVARAGFSDARADFECFFGRDELEVPAIVVGGAKRDEAKFSGRVRAVVRAVQVPIDRIVCGYHARANGRPCGGGGESI